MIPKWRSEEIERDRDAKEATKKRLKTKEDALGFQRTRTLSLILHSLTLGATADRHTHVKRTRFSLFCAVGPLSERERERTVNHQFQSITHSFSLSSQLQQTLSLSTFARNFDTVVEAEAATTTRPHLASSHRTCGSTTLKVALERRGAHTHLFKHFICTHKTPPDPRPFAQPPPALAFIFPPFHFDRLVSDLAPPLRRLRRFQACSKRPHSDFDVIHPLPPQYFHRFIRSPKPPLFHYRYSHCRPLLSAHPKSSFLASSTCLCILDKQPPSVSSFRGTRRRLIIHGSCCRHSSQ